MYEELVKKNSELTDQLFYAKLNTRVSEGSGKLIPSSEVVESDKEHNPFASLKDEDLFN